jgi:uncharacterized protein (TIGR02145 family)
MKKMSYIILLSLSLILCNCSAKLKDPRDGKKYKIVTIGSQTWMAEDLEYNSPNSKASPKQNGRTIKQGDQVILHFNGRYYNWNEANKVCPEGWHLPSLEEWQILIENCGGNFESARRLRSKSDWYIDPYQSVYGNNESGFDAKPVGRYDSYNDEFLTMGFRGDWWTSTLEPAGINIKEGESANIVYIYHTKEYALLNIAGVESGLCVRCIKDK